MLILLKIGENVDTSVKLFTPNNQFFAPCHLFTCLVFTNALFTMFMAYRVT